MSRIKLPDGARKYIIHSCLIILLCTVSVLFQNNIIMFKTVDKLRDVDIYSDEIYRNLLIDTTKEIYEYDWKRMAVYYVDKYIQREKNTPVDYLNRKLFIFLDVDYCVTKNRRIEISNYALWIQKYCPQLKNASLAYTRLLSESVFFPVALYENTSNYDVDNNEEKQITFEDSWNEDRIYGGERKHEGCDIMAGNNQADYFPVISVCDGVVEKMGWLELGGNRVGIRSDNGIYYYYAHLSSYSQELIEGKRVFAGELLGFMGDTGYGSEGTTGKFDVHLHFGIYIHNYDIGEDISVNPYSMLCMLKDRTIKYNN